LADVVQRTDMRMLEPRDIPRLALESLAALRIRRQARREHLDRDGAVEPRVPGFEYLTHAALADEGDAFVGAEARAGREHMEDWTSKPAVRVDFHRGAGSRSESAEPTQTDQPILRRNCVLPPHRAGHARRVDAAHDSAWITSDRVMM